MTIVYKLLDDGSFVAGDTDTCLTAFAYPRSPAASLATRRPYAAARGLVEGQHPADRLTPWGRNHDAINWRRLA